MPSDISAEEALDNNKTFDVVWAILNALRSHDDRFNAMVNKIALNKQKPNKQTGTPSVTIGRPGLGAMMEKRKHNKLRMQKLPDSWNFVLVRYRTACMPNSWKSAVTVFIGRIGQRRSVLLRTNLLSVFPNLFSPAYTKGIQ